MITGKKNLPNNHYIYFDSFKHVRTLINPPLD